MILRGYPALVVAALLIVACSPEVTPTAPPSPRPAPVPTPTPTPLIAGHYADDMLSFDYPLEWQATQPWYPSSVSSLKLMASTEQLRDPCIQSGTTVLCRHPIEELSEGGLFISWWRWGLTHGAPGPDPNVGELIHVGGRSARISDAGEAGHCLNMKADQSLRVEIPDPTLDGSWTVMDACLREPIADARAQIDEMLASIEWLGPQPTQVVPLSVGGVDFSLQLFDDTRHVTAAELVSAGPTGGEPEVVATGDSLQVFWVGTDCQRSPILGLSEDAAQLVVLLEPRAGPTQGGVTPCPDIGLSLGVALTLDQPVAQEDVYLEVW